jgi:hypothetical protein
MAVENMWMFTVSTRRARTVTPGPAVQDEAPARLGDGSVSPPPMTDRSDRVG